MPIHRIHTTCFFNPTGATGLCVNRKGPNRFWVSEKTNGRASPRLTTGSSDMNLILSRLSDKVVNVRKKAQKPLFAKQSL